MGCCGPGRPRASWSRGRSPQPGQASCKAFPYVTSRSPWQASEEGSFDPYWVCSRSWSKWWDSHLRFSGPCLSTSPATTRIIIIIITYRCREVRPTRGLTPGVAVSAESSPLPTPRGAWQGSRNVPSAPQPPSFLHGEARPSLHGAGVRVPAEAHTPYVWGLKLKVRLISFSTKWALSSFLTNMCLQ